MTRARFDIYGRYELDIERREGRWIVYMRGEGKRRQHPDIFIPPEVSEDALAGFLEDLLHEEGSPSTVIRRLGEADR